MPKLAKHVVKPGSAALVSFVVDALTTSIGPKNNPAKAASSPAAKRPTTAAAKPTLALKPKPTAGASTATGGSDGSCQLDGDISSDPIAQAMTIRLKLGGINNNATEADAKKNNYPMLKAAKHPVLKSNALLDISLPVKASDAPPASPLKKVKAIVKATSSVIKMKPATSAAEKKKPAAAQSEVDLKDSATH